MHILSALAIRTNIKKIPDITIIGYIDGFSLRKRYIWFLLYKKTNSRLELGIPSSVDSHNNNRSKKQHYSRIRRVKSSFLTILSREKLFKGSCPTLLHTPLGNPAIQLPKIASKTQREVNTGPA